MKIPKIIQTLIFISIIIWGLYVFGRAVYKNYAIQNQINQLEKQIVDLANQNDALTNLLRYFKTNSFIEREARSKFGLKKPGEVVIAVPSDEQLKYTIDKSQEQKSEEQPIPVYQKWWNIFLKS